MLERFARRITLVCVATVGFATAAGHTLAEERRIPAPKPTTPILVLNAAGVDRVLAGSDGLLKMVDRTQWSLALRGLVAVSTNGLQGIDRRRPFGVMTFVNPGEVPEPVGVVYVPVTGGDEFLASLKTLEFSLKPAVGVTGGYLATADKQAFALRIRGKYAFLARSIESLKREFGDPAERFSRLSRAFDVAVTFHLAATPSGMKAMVLDYVRASAELGFEIRRGESASAHKLRKAIGSAALAGFEEAVRDGRSLTLGLKVAKSTSGLSLEARLEARAGTPLANGLNDLEADGKQPSLSGPRSTELRIATNWKPPASLIPVFDALVRPTPAPKNAGDGNAAWSALRRGLFATGIRLVAWSSATGPALPAGVAVVSFPNEKAAAAQVLGTLAAFRSRGLVKTETVPIAAQRPAMFQRVTWSGGDAVKAAGVVGLVGNTAWIAVGRENVLALLQREIKAVDRGRAATPGNLIHLSGRWSLLKSWLQSGTWPRPSNGESAADRFELTITREPNVLILRSTVPAAAVREATAPVLKRLLPR